MLKNQLFDRNHESLELWHQAAPASDVDEIFALDRPICSILIHPQTDPDGEGVDDLAAHAMAIRATLSKHPIASRGRAESTEHGVVGPNTGPYSPLASEVANHSWTSTVDGQLAVRVEHCFSNRSCP